MTILQEHIREKVLKVEESLSLVLNSFFFSVRHAFEWMKFIQRHRDVRQVHASYTGGLIRNRLACREIALSAIATELIRTAGELCPVAQMELEHTMQWLFRKQLECRVNALFFAFDETGKSSRLYHYFEMEKQASLHPENEDLRHVLSLADALLEDEIKQIREKNKDLRGDWWAISPEGKHYTDLVSRLEFTYRVLRREARDKKLSNVKSASRRLKDHEIQMYRQSNRIVHTSLTGPVEQLSVSDILMSTHFSMTGVLSEYRQIVMPKLDNSTRREEEQLWAYSTVLLDIAWALIGTSLEIVPPEKFYAQP